MQREGVRVDQTAEIANQTFILYKLAPLFEFDKAAIATQERLFAIHLCANLKLHDGRKTRRGASQNKNDTFDGDLRKVELSTVNLPDFTSYHPDIQPLRFLFEVFNYNDERLLAYSFYMIPSPRVPENEKVPGVFAYYPLLLVKAPRRVRREISDWFEKRYVAACAPLFMYPATMLDAVNIWIESIHDVERKQEQHLEVPESMLRPPLVLEYDTGDENISKVAVKISRQQALDICERIPNHGQFMETFEKHVEESAHFRLNTLTLHTVNSSIASVRKDGYVKISQHAYKAFAIRLIRSWVNLAIEKTYKSF